MTVFSLESHDFMRSGVHQCTPATVTFVYVMGAAQSQAVLQDREPYPGFARGLPYEPNTEAGFWEPSMRSDSRFDSFQSRAQQGKESSEVPLWWVAL